MDKFGATEVQSTRKSKIKLESDLAIPLQRSINQKIIIMACTPTLSSF